MESTPSTPKSDISDDCLIFGGRSQTPESITPSATPSRSDQDDDSSVSEPSDDDQQSITRSDQDEDDLYLGIVGEPQIKDDDEYAYLRDDTLTLEDWAPKFTNYGEEPHWRPSAPEIADIVAAEVLAGSGVFPGKVPHEVTLMIIKKLEREPQVITVAFENWQKVWTYDTKAGDEAIPFCMQDDQAVLKAFFEYQYNPAPILNPSDSIKTATFPFMNYELDTLYLWYFRCSTAPREHDLYVQTIKGAVAGILNSADARPHERLLKTLKVDYCVEMCPDLHAFVCFFKPLTYLERLEICSHENYNHHPSYPTHRCHIGRREREKEHINKGLTAIEDDTSISFVVGFTGGNGWEYDIDPVEREKGTYQDDDESEDESST